MEEDHEELLQCTDDESLSETEEQCCPMQKSEEHYLPPLTFFLHTKLKFFSYLVLLLLSTFCLLIVVPLYTSSINAKGNVYSILIINTLYTCCIHLVIFGILSVISEKYKYIKFFKIPIKFWELIKLAGIYLLCGLIYFYATDRNKVLCHLQDPLKGIIVVFSLLYYFFFCRNLMGLHRIFSTTTVIVGLFVAIDYGLCDEFVCRGYDRKQAFDDSGPWSWKVHSIWTGIYISGLTSFAAYFTLLDRHVMPENDMMSHNLISNCFVNTISRSVTTSTSNLVAANTEEIQSRVNVQLPKCKSALQLSFWIHIFAFGLMLLTFWIDFIPGIGKGNTPAESWNYTLNGLMCHVTKPNTENCGNVFWYMLAFQIAYAIFALSSVKFLMLSQSAVFTVAAMSCALPLIGIWWSMFYAAPNGILVWSPKIRGEFVCSIIGIPIVSIGLGLLCKAHFEDYRRFITGRLTARNQLP